MAFTDAAADDTIVSPIMEEKNEISSAVSDSSHETSRTVEFKATFDNKLALKVDLYLLAPMLFLNFVSLMGRTNIGTALIQKMPQDLKLDAMKVFLSISMTFIPLIVCEVPSNLLMRVLNKKYNITFMRYLALITFFLGLVTLGQGFDNTYGAMLATRFVVGIFDAGLIPGCVYVCSLYYPAAHLQWRMSMLMVSNIASNVVSNILAYAIAHIHNSNGYHGWRWIFIIEGCLTMGISIACFFINIGRPEESSFLTEEEKEVISREVESRATTIGLVAEWKIFFSNILNYVWASCYVLTCSTTYSVAIFAPSFVTAFHPTYTVPQVQGQVVPIFVVSAVACLISAWLSDRFKHRAGFAIGGYLITMIGFIILRQNHISKPSIAMLGLYFVSMGTFTCLPLLWNLTLVNLPSPFQKAIGCGFVVGIGNVGGFISSWLFRTGQAPHYHTGMTDSLIFTLVALGLVAFAWVFITISNRRLDSRTLSQDSNVDVKDGSQYIGSTGQVLRYRA